MGLVYFIRDGEGFTKIGVTTNLTRRLRELNCGVSSNLVVLKTFEFKNYRRVESSLHNLYESFNVRGEWYDLTDAMLDKIYSRVHILNKNLEID